MEIVDGRRVPQHELLRLWTAFIAEVTADDPFEFPVDNWRALGRKYLDRACADPDFAVFVAAQEQRYVGMAIASLRKWPPDRILARADYVHISDVYVEPAERGRGTAAALMQAAIAWAAARGVRHVDLNVREGSAAERLYRRLGFQAYSVNMFYRIE